MGLTDNGSLRGSRTEWLKTWWTPEDLFFIPKPYFPPCNGIVLLLLSCPKNGETLLRSFSLGCCSETISTSDMDLLCFAGNYLFDLIGSTSLSDIPGNWTVMPDGLWVLADFKIGCWFLLFCTPTVSWLKTSYKMLLTHWSNFIPWFPACLYKSPLWSYLSFSSLFSQVVNELFITWILTEEQRWRWLSRHRLLLTKAATRPLNHWCHRPSILAASVRVRVVGWRRVLKESSWLEGDTDWFHVG